MIDTQALLDKYTRKIDESTTKEQLEAVRLEALGKKGEISLLMRELGKMSPEERQTVGAHLNAIKSTIADKLAHKQDIFETAALDAKLAGDWMDVTLPAPTLPQGSIHPVSYVTQEVVDIFLSLGFDVKEGPHIETDYNNFDALNIPPEHPARQEHDTFFMRPGTDSTRHVLRTHTSPVQIRTLLEQKPPVRFIAPGRVYRCDYDQTHTPMFHQYEGLVLDKNISMAHLKWTLEEFCRQFFEVKTVELRFRASHFPFTEPSAEVDIRCSWHKGQLRIGEGDDWMEILGSGMVHPNVLRACDIDPQEWQGFAFGMGIDRIAMLKYGIPDLRAFFDSDLRWLRHYGFSTFGVTA